MASELVILSDGTSEDEIAIVGSMASRKQSSLGTQLADLDSSSDSDGSDIGALLASARQQQDHARSTSDTVIRKHSASVSREIDDDLGTAAPRPKKRGSGQAGSNPDDQSAREVKRKTDQAAKEAKKAAREAAKAEREAAKAAEKSAKKREKEEAKVAKEALKSYQDKLKDANKLRVSKNDALREIEVHMAHDLKLPSSPIAGAMPEINARLETNNSKTVFLSEAETTVNSTIRFRRRVTSQWNEVEKRFLPLDQERFEWEPTLVIVTSVDSIVDQIAEEDEMFIRWLKDVRLTMGITDEQVLLLVRGMGKYHTKSVAVVNKSYRESAAAGLMGAQGRKSSGPKDNSKRVTKDMVESELLRAQVMERIFVVLVDETAEIEDWMFNLAGDVAVRRYKRLEKSHLAFAAPDGQRKAKDAAEALEYILQEVPSVTVAAAASIVQSFPTFRELMEAYEAAEKRGRGAAESLVEGSEVQRLATGAASSRRIGKVTSKKVYDVFRCNDPLTLL